MAKEKSLSSLLQKVGQNPNFYSLDGLLKEFIKKNNLPKGYDVKDTRHGKLIRWRNDHESYLMLSEEGNRSEHLMQPYLRPYIGGNGKHVYTSNEIVYTLEGEIKGKKINLEAEITETQDYELKKNPASPCFVDVPVKNGEPEVYKSRHDSEKYWFVIARSKR